MSTDLSFWREKYKCAPLVYKPIIAALGKLIKLGNVTTTKDVTPAEMQALCKLTQINIDVNFDDAQNFRWNIPPRIVSAFADRIISNYNKLLIDCAADFFNCKPVKPAPTPFDNFDYSAEINNWIDFLRDVYRRVKGTDKADAVIAFAQKFAAGKRLDEPELHDALIDLAENVIKQHDDLYTRFLEDFLFALPIKTVVDFPDVEFWQLFEDFTGGALYRDAENRFLTYFKPDVYKFLKIVAEEVF